MTTSEREREIRERVAEAKSYTMMDSKSDIQFLLAQLDEARGALRKLFKAETDEFSSHEEMVEALAEAERVLKEGK